MDGGYPWRMAVAGISGEQWKDIKLFFDIDMRGMNVPRYIHILLTFSL
jgi:hypothetical protein